MAQKYALTYLNAKMIILASSTGLNRWNFQKKWNLIFCNVLKNVIGPQLDSTPLGKWRKFGHQKIPATIEPHPIPTTEFSPSPLESIHNAPRQHRRLWRGRKFSEKDIDQVLTHLN